MMRSCPHESNRAALPGGGGSVILKGPGDTHQIMIAAPATFAGEA
jgi:hypothetical protein